MKTCRSTRRALSHNPFIHREKSDDEKDALSTVLNSFYGICSNEIVILIMKYATDDYTDLRSM